MKTYSLPPDADLLVATAESVAAVLEHKAEELGIGSDAEALLRVSIASAYYGKVFNLGAEALAEVQNSFFIHFIHSAILLPR